MTTWTNKKECRKIASAIRQRYDIVFFDLETTGLSPVKDRVVQFAAIRVSHTGAPGTESTYGYEETDSINIYIKPPFLMGEKVISVHHITNEFLQDKPTEEECLQDIITFFSKAPCVLSGYNVKKFDLKFMAQMMERHGVGVKFPDSCCVDVYVAASELVQKSKEIPSLKLTSLCEMYGITPEGGEAHSAIVDVRMTKELLFMLCQEYLGIKEPEGSMEPQILHVSRWNKSKTVNYIYVELKAFDGNSFISGKVHFDIWRNCWVEDTPDIFSHINMYRLEELASTYAGCKKWPAKSKIS